MKSTFKALKPANFNILNKIMPILNICGYSNAACRAIFVKNGGEYHHILRRMQLVPKLSLNWH